MTQWTIHDLAWGTIPAWLGAGSLLLAFRIFLQDRTKEKGAQIEQVGAWTAMEGTPTQVPEHDNMRQVDIKCRIKNASNLPVYLVGFRFRSSLQSHRDVGRYGVHHDYDARQDLFQPNPIGPEETWTSPGRSHVVWTIDPDRETEFPVSLNVVLDEALFIDAAGRKWICKPTRGRPRLVRWYNFRLRARFKRELEQATWDPDRSRFSEKDFVEMVAGKTGRERPGIANDHN